MRQFWRRFDSVADLLINRSAIRRNFGAISAHYFGAVLAHYFGAVLPVLAQFGAVLAVLAVLPIGAGLIADLRRKGSISG